MNTERTYTFLVVEDDSLSRNLIRLIIEELGHKVLEAKSGDAALEAFEIAAPDIVLLDINIGDPDGFEVCKKIRETYPDLGVTIVFLTGMSSEEHVIKALDEGGDDYIKKPFSANELSARLTAHIKRLERQSQKPKWADGNNFTIGSTLRSQQDEYILDSRLAQGGMGVIFAGHRKSDNMRVAIKTLNADNIKHCSDIQRFLREIELSIQLNHENLVQSLDFIKTPNYVCYVMEYIDGKPIDELMLTGFISIKTSINIVRQVAQGLEYLHSQGLVHRDIKPANILVTSNDRVVLVDLGLVKKSRQNSQLTTQGIIIGTPDYLSPEQVREKEVTICSDIYSLGVTWYYMISGLLPFEATSTNELMVARLYYDPKPLNIDGRVWAVIKKMLEKDIENRYATPTELLRDLNAL
ncbi:protein kinase domain-containing protein [Candidatus Uabimicrobium amorphum]|uniref:Serine/threonine protein kinase n=1 Tax=Uabimicrobium amorphum TaxID=2596890 RepID=A0A5S9IMY0_UABAM|nr:protein kinase [Candidatus Uabimicrobium amorphum]BBM84863.1 serine/threonine protein kinase [Candidatus Uabimicrobium amorphum]